MNDLLWNKIVETGASALKNNVLFPISTKSIIVRDKIDFIVRISNSVDSNIIIDKKCTMNENLKMEKKINPFYPPDPKLFIESVKGTHNLILNKFNVLKNHLLLTTKEYEKQSSLLNLDDFTAILDCMKNLDGVKNSLLIFYNCGQHSGRSVSHKHIQLVSSSEIYSSSDSSSIPIPIPIPIEEHILGEKKTGVFCLEEFKFENYCMILSLSELESQESDQIKYLLNCFRILHNHIKDHESFNFIMTANWMMMIPRSKASVDNVPVNSLGYCGSLYLKSQSDLPLLIEKGPLHILNSCGFIRQ